jgi:hypothetical protein
MAGCWLVGNAAAGGRSPSRQHPGEACCETCCDAIAEGATTGAAGACRPRDNDIQACGGKGGRKEVQWLRNLYQRVPRRGCNSSTHGTG